MAGSQVIFETAQFSWSYSGGTVQPTEFHLKWGNTSGSHPNMKVFLATAPKTAAVKDVVSGPGQYYAIMVAANAVGEGAKSAELPFVVSSGVPDGSVSFSIG